MDTGRHTAQYAQYGEGSGGDNPSDLQTKYLDGSTMAKHLEAIGIQEREGRPEVAPEHVPGRGGPECEGDGVDVVQAEARTKRRSAMRLRLKGAKAWWHLRLGDFGEGCVDAVGTQSEEVSLEGMDNSFEERWKSLCEMGTCWSHSMESANANDGE